jgi:hypothetical protein
VAGARLPGVPAPPGSALQADEDTTRPGAEAGAARAQPGAARAPVTDRARAQQCHALAHRHRPEPAVAGGRPRAGDGTLRGAAHLPGAPHALATEDFIGINSNVASYLTGCCADYGLLEKGQKSVRNILPSRLESKVAAYLPYDLHFTGLGDNSVIGHGDWALFGLTRTDVRDELKRLSLKGYVIVQSAGDVSRIGWHYKNMEALTDVLARS